VKERIRGKGRGRGSDCQAVNSQLSKNGNRKLPELPAAYRFPYDVCVPVCVCLCVRQLNRLKEPKTEKNRVEPSGKWEVEEGEGKKEVVRVTH